MAKVTATSKPPRPIVILDYGSQYTQLITRRVREQGFYSQVVSGSVSLERLQSLDPEAVILSGGPNSVYDPGAPGLPTGFLEWQARAQMPVLGICYGMQLLAQNLGGKVARAESREYGRMNIVSASGSEWLGALGVLSGRPVESLSVWMSHGDHVEQVPAGFKVCAQSESGSLAIIENSARKILALQFHPEVTHTERGSDILKRFLRGVAGLAPNWSMGTFADSERERIRSLVGANEHVICALSGGVDSAVAATLVHQAIGDRLHCVFVDHGMLRFEERERVSQLLREELRLPLTVVDASERFLGRLAGVSDPEQKRKIIGDQFIREFQEFCKQAQAAGGVHAKYLVQGTLYPDVIESSPAAGSDAGGGHSVTIKSHHNVGGLPKDLGFELIEPLRMLFKDEVRTLGKALGVPESFLQRHPFPGPGLAVRIIGDITRERVALLQRVDEIFIQELHRAGLYSKIWQAFAVFLPIKSVGVQGDGRTHDHVVALRAVTSSDGMTADWFHFDGAFLAKVSSRICNEVRGVNRVVYDISSKPPATIEWE